MCAVRVGFLQLEDVEPSKRYPDLIQLLPQYNPVDVSLDRPPTGSIA